MSNEKSFSPKNIIIDRDGNRWFNAQAVAALCGVTKSAFDNFVKGKNQNCKEATDNE